MNPDQVVADYQQDVAAMAEKAEQAKAKIAQLIGTASSGDGAVTVSVTGNGALRDVSFGPRASELPLSRLSSEIMRAARQAQASASRQLVTIMEGLVGENSDAMHFVREQIPSTEEPEDDVASSESSEQLVVNDEQRVEYEYPTNATTAPTAGQPTHQPPSTTRPTRPAPADDDEDFDLTDPLG